MATEREAKAYRSGNEDGIASANADAPTPENHAGNVVNRAWSAAEDQGDLESRTEREEYFVGWTHGYVNRAESIEDHERRRQEDIALTPSDAHAGTDGNLRHPLASSSEGSEDADGAQESRAN